MDQLTTASRGVLPWMLIASALVAYPISRLLLWRYRRSVVRSMDATSGAGEQAPVRAVAAAPAEALRVVWDPPVESPGRELAYLLRAPWLLALVYVIAGAVFVAIVTAAWLLSTHDRVLLASKLLVVFWMYFWPAPLTVNLVAATGRTRWGVLLAYFAVFAAIVVWTMWESPALSWYGLPGVWLILNAPPTLLFGAYLSRRIRAIGPLVFTFTAIALTTGGTLLTPGMLAAVAKPALAIGLGAGYVFWGVQIAGLLVFALVGWIVLKWLGRRYERKRLSEQSLTVDALWLLFALVQSVFYQYAWIFSGLIAFASFKLATAAGFALLRRLPRPERRTLLLLRVFALGARSERLFERLRTHWLRLGNIALIAGPDLATTTIEPHELLSFVSGKLARAFVAGPEDLERRIAATDVQPDPDGRYRVNDLFCHADTWRPTVRALAGRSDAVLMDLRSFTPKNAGCLYELGVLLESVDLSRIVLVADGDTDRRFLEENLQEQWQKIGPGSPNRRLAAPAVRIVKVATRVTSRDVRRLLAALAAVT